MRRVYETHEALLRGTMLSDERNRMTPAERLARTKKPRGKRVYSAHKRCAVAHVRLTLGLTIRDVQEATGLSNAFICQVEHGCEISLTNARKLSKFFGKGIDELWPA